MRPNAKVGEVSITPSAKPDTILPRDEELTPPADLKTYEELNAYCKTALKDCPPGTRPMYGQKTAECICHRIKIHLRDDITSFSTSFANTKATPSSTPAPEIEIELLHRHVEADGYPEEEVGDGLPYAIRSLSDELANKIETEIDNGAPNGGW
jgi:hypothetical protein